MTDTIRAPREPRSVRKLSDLQLPEDETKGLTAARFSSVLFVALALAPALAHLLELPNKIALARDDYLTVQQIYRGWSLLGFVVAGALLSTAALTVLTRKRPREFALALVALFCIVGAQLLFWTFTFPANQYTHNWTMLPDNWEVLRNQWEYSHAAGAALNLIALIVLIVSLLDSHRMRTWTPKISGQRTQAHPSFEGVASRATRRLATRRHVALVFSAPGSTLRGH